MESNKIRAISFFASTYDINEDFKGVVKRGEKIYAGCQFVIQKC